MREDRLTLRASPESRPEAPACELGVRHLASLVWWPIQGSRWRFDVLGLLIPAYC